MPELNRSNLVFAQTMICNGIHHRPKESVPESIPDSMLKVWIDQGIVKPSAEVGVPPAGTARVEPAGKEALDKERAEAAAKKAKSDAPARLPLDTALDPEVVASMDLDELNVLAVERGYGDEAFVDTERAINYLSANFPR